MVDGKHSFMARHSLSHPPILFLSVQGTPYDTESDCKGNVIILDLVNTLANARTIKMHTQNVLSASVLFKHSVLYAQCMEEQESVWRSRKVYGGAGKGYILFKFFPFEVEQGRRANSVLTLVSI